MTLFSTGLQATTDHQPELKTTPNGNLIKIDSISTEIAIMEKAFDGGKSAPFKYLYTVLLDNIKEPIKEHLTQSIYFATMINYGFLQQDHNGRYIPPKRVMEEIGGKYGPDHFEIYRTREDGFGFNTATPEDVQRLHNEVSPIVLDTLITIGEELNYAWEEANDLYHSLKERERHPDDTKRNIEASLKRTLIFKQSKIEILERNLYRAGAREAIAKLSRDA